MKYTIKLLLMTLIITLASTGTSFASNQVPSEWAKEAVQMMQGSSEFRGETFKNYQKPITRQEFIYLAVRLYELIRGEDAIQSNGIKFTDTSDPYALKGASIGITKGIGNGQFGPDLPLTREQLATLLVDTLQKANISVSPENLSPFKDSHDISTWALSAVYAAKSKGIIGGVGDNRFDPKGQATVEQALVIMKNILSNEELGMHKRRSCAYFFGEVKSSETLIYQEKDYNPNMELYQYGGGPPQAYYLYDFFREGLLSGTTTFDISERPQNISTMRAIYRSSYYDKDFMKKLGKDFKLEYVKRDAREAYVLKAVYREDPNFLSSHLLEIAAYEKEYPPVSRETAYNPIKIDIYRELGQEKEVVLQRFDEKISREDILVSFEERLIKAAIANEERIEIGRFDITFEEAENITKRLYYDRDFNKLMNASLYIARPLPNEPKTYFRLMYEKLDNFQQVKKEIIDLHEGIKPTEEVVSNQELVDEMQNQATSDLASESNESLDGFKEMWAVVDSQEVGLVDLSAYTISATDYDRLYQNVLNKAQEKYGQFTTVLVYGRTDISPVEKLAVYLDKDQGGLTGEIQLKMMATLNPPQVITLKNKEIEEMVRKNLPDHVNVITRDFLANYDRLFLDNLKDTNLEDLEYFDSLTVLHIYNMPIEDLGIIKDKKYLLELSLVNTNMQDISILKNLKLLRKLEFISNRIKDLTPIAELDNLQKLRIDEQLAIGYNELERLQGVEFSGAFSNDLGDMVEAYKEITRVVNEKISPDMTDLEKMQVLNDYLIDTVAYDYDVYNGKKQATAGTISPIGLISSKKMVCEGYAVTLAALANTAGVEAGYVVNAPMNHAWTSAKINGQWREFDATWNDIENPDYFEDFNALSDDFKAGVSYRNKYFNLSHDEMAKNHGPKEETKMIR